MSQQQLSNILYYASIETNILRQRTQKLMYKDYQVFVNSSFSSFLNLDVTEEIYSILKMT